MRKYLIVCTAALPTPCILSLYLHSTRRRQLLSTVIRTHPHSLPYPGLPYLQSGCSHMSLQYRHQKQKAPLFFLSDKAKHEPGLSGTDLGTGLDRDGLPPEGVADPCGRGQETSTLLPSFSYFTVTFNYPNEVPSAEGRRNTNPGQP